MIELEATVLCSRSSTGFRKTSSGTSFSDSPFTFSKKPSLYSELPWAPWSEELSNELCAIVASYEVGLRAFSSLGLSVLDSSKAKSVCERLVYESLFRLIYESTAI